jgi:Zn-dependent protease
VTRDLLERVLFVIPLWISLGVHEWAHAWAAYALGDDTAEKLGRMSLNPFVHLDPIGTVLLPILGVPFGWAKPVPVQPTRFHSSLSMSMGMLIVAAAGPLSNAILAVLVIAIDIAVTRGDPTFASRESLLSRIIDMAIIANVAMALFNLLPFPPLDGSRIVDGLVPFEYRSYWDRYGKALGLLTLIAFVLFGLPAVIEWVREARGILHSIFVPMGDRILSS